MCSVCQVKVEPGQLVSALRLVEREEAADEAAQVAFITGQL